MKSKFLTARSWLAISLCAGSAFAVELVLAVDSAFAADPVPSLSAPDLAQGRFSAMHMLLEKTVLKVDVLTVDVRVAKPTQDKFASLAAGKTYSEELEQQLAQAAIGADRVAVQLKFKRDVGLERWMDVVRENIGQARSAGLISAAVEKKVGDSLPVRFAALKERGFEDGDRVLYDVKPDSLRTVVVAANGSVLLDQVTKEADVSRVVVSSYFAPGSEFREPLLRSLLK
jgi:hypothetical protein